MTYTYRLSRRLARLRAGFVAPFLILVLSCSDNGMSGPDDASLSPSGVAIAPGAAALGISQTMQFRVGAQAAMQAGRGGRTKGKRARPVALVVTPGTVALAPQVTSAFTAQTTWSDGSTSLVGPLVWTATGGTVDSTGKYTAGSAPGDYRVIVTADPGMADTALVTISTEPPTAETVQLTPGSAALAPGATQAFQLAGTARGGLAVAVSPAYVATGGTVSSTGVYRAGATAGTFRVIATDSISGKADTATVTIAVPAATLTSITVTPASVSLQSGASQQFAAAGRLTDGSSSPVTVTWVAAGGTISNTGLYTAGPVTGSYPVIGAHAASGLADTVLVGVTAPNAPPPPPPGPAQGIVVLPGQSIQAAVDGHGPGTAFLLKAGRHTRQNVLPKSGDVFRCEAGAVLDGENVTPYAFRRSGSDPDDVRIVGCVIEHYAPPVQMGAILAGGHAASDGTSGWIVDSTEVRYNTNLGIRLGHRMKVRWSKVHHNSTLGIGGVGDDILVENTEIAFNNFQNAGTLGFEAGGTKFVLTNGLVLRGNYVHDNVGPGLWLDIGNDRSLIEGNRVEDNQQEGIVEEISYSSIIRNNTLRRNGLGDTRRTAWPWGAGIGIHSSGGSGIEVTGNVLEGNAHGIALIQQARGAANNDPAERLGPYLVQNVYVHGNSITLGAGSVSGSAAVTDAGDNAIFTSRNNRFTANTYRIPTVVRPFAWMNSWRTDSEWRGYGQDVSGTFAK